MHMKKKNFLITIIILVSFSGFLKFNAIIQEWLFLIPLITFFSTALSFIMINSWNSKNISIWKLIFMSSLSSLISIFILLYGRNIKELIINIIYLPEVINLFILIIKCIDDYSMIKIGKHNINDINIKKYYKINKKSFTLYYSPEDSNENRTPRPESRSNSPESQNRSRSNSPGAENRVTIRPRSDSSIIVTTVTNNTNITITSINSINQTQQSPIWPTIDSARRLEQMQTRTVQSPNVPSNQIVQSPNQSIQSSNQSIQSSNASSNTVTRRIDFYNYSDVLPETINLLNPSNDTVREYRVNDMINKLITNNILGNNNQLWSRIEGYKIEICTAWLDEQKLSIRNMVFSPYARDAWIVDVFPDLSLKVICEKDPYVASRNYNFNNDNVIDFVECVLPDNTIIRLNNIQYSMHINNLRDISYMNIFAEARDVFEENLSQLHDIQLDLYKNSSMPNIPMENLIELRKAINCMCIFQDKPELFKDFNLEFDSDNLKMSIEEMYNLIDQLERSYFHLKRSILVREYILEILHEKDINGIYGAYKIIKREDFLGEGNASTYEEYKSRRGE